ncbi:hypothetical protein B0H13DRAFT_2271430 [Mycena leptocephala]|nr:hypothetical protein B0H13DRAFT_2271430 [Mycena leptocephala]
MSIGWSEGNGMSTPSKDTRGLSLGAAGVGPGTKLSSLPLCTCVPLSPLPLRHCNDFHGTTLRRAILLIQASGALCCCTRCLDARLVFFAEYKVPPNKPGGKDSRCHEAYARGYVYLQNWMRVWMAAREEGVDGLHLVDHDIERSRTQCIERMAENIPRLLYHTYVKDWLKDITRSPSDAPAVSPGDQPRNLLQTTRQFGGVALGSLPFQLDSSLSVRSNGSEPVRPSVTGFMTSMHFELGLQNPIRVIKRRTVEKPITGKECDSESARYPMGTGDA